MSRRFMELKVLLAQVSWKPLFWETEGEGDAKPTQPPFVARQVF